VKFRDLLEQAKPKKTAMTDLKELNRLVTKVQAAWRGYVQRKIYLKSRLPDLKKVSQQYARTGKVQFKDDEEEKKGKGVPPKKLTPQ
jgi:hypothetical protein